MKCVKISSLVLAGLLIFYQPAVAAQLNLQETLREMADLLGKQQKQLDDQGKELAEQRELIRQLQGAQQTGKKEPVPSPVEKSPAEPKETTIAQQPGTATDTPDSGDDQSAQDQAKEALAKQQDAAPQTAAQQIAELQGIMDDPSNTIYDANFPGAWYLPGTTAAMKLGGYVNLAVVNSFDPLTIPDRFIVGSIPPEGETVPGAVEGTQVSAQQTRLNLEYREQTKLGEIRAFVEGDFEGDNDGFRLRHAFGQFRSILAGKTWSTFMDINARPEEVDFEGINGEVLLRHSQIRWSPQFGKNLHLKIALEDPATDVINGESQRGNFDLVASLDKMPLGPLGRWNYRVGAILRDLKAIPSDSNPDDDITSSGTQSATGWGVTTGGRQPVKWWGGEDYFLWQLTYGEGIGHYINDLGTIGGGDAVFDPQGKLHALPVFSGYVTYQHRWPMTWGFDKAWPGILRSSLTLSWVDISNFEFQEGSDYDRTLRASLNLIYNPTPNIFMGLELLWGERNNKDGSKGKATQLQFAMRYIF
jgi:hypothetical protein